MRAGYGAVIDEKAGYGAVIDEKAGYGAVKEGSNPSAPRDIDSWNRYQRFLAINHKKGVSRGYIVHLYELFDL